MESFGARGRATGSPVHTLDFFGNSMQTRIFLITMLELHRSAWARRWIDEIAQTVAQDIQGEYGEKDR